MLTRRVVGRDHPGPSADFDIPFESNVETIVDVVTVGEGLHRTDPGFILLRGIALHPCEVGVSNRLNAAPIRVFDATGVRREGDVAVGVDVLGAGWDRQRRRIRVQRVQTEELVVTRGHLEVHRQRFRDVVVAFDEDGRVSLVRLDREERTVVVNTPIEEVTQRTTTSTRERRSVFAVDVRLAEARAYGITGQVVQRGFTVRANLLSRVQAVPCPGDGLTRNGTQTTRLTGRGQRGATETLIVVGNVDLVTIEHVRGNDHAATVALDTPDRRDLPHVAFARLIVGRPLCGDVEPFEITLRDEVHNAGNRVGSVKGGSAVLDDFDTLDRDGRDQRIDIARCIASTVVPGRYVALAVDQRQRSTVAEVTEIDVSPTVRAFPWKVAARVWEPEFHGIDAMTSATSAAPMSSMSADVMTERGEGESAAERRR